MPGPWARFSALKRPACRPRRVIRIRSSKAPAAAILAWAAYVDPRLDALRGQMFESDLSAYAGQTVRIRFAFQSDTSGTFPGVYVDDVYVGH